MGRRQRLLEIASSQRGEGHFTAAQARALGYDTSTITYHARTGRFERVSRGFYRLAEFPALPYEDVIAAWVKAGPERAVVSHDGDRRPADCATPPTIGDRTARLRG